MSSEWQLVRLDDIADLNGGYAFKSEEYTTQGHFVLRTVNITDDGRINRAGAAFVSHESAMTYQRFALKPLDTLFVMVGATLGKTGLVGLRDLPALLNQNMWVVRSKVQMVDPLFLHYAFKVLSKPLTGMASGSARGFVKRDDYRQMKLLIPAHAEQLRISLLLGALDDRITLLRETNATLEAIAQALFKSWFVDFDPVRAKMEGRVPEGMNEATAALFPDGFEESALGLVPRGWRVGALKDCCLRVESGGTPKRAIPEYWNGNVSWLTSGEVRSPIVFDTKEKITPQGVSDSSAKLWPEGTTIVAMYGATAGEVCLLAKPATANQACCGLIPLSKFRSFLYFRVRRERENLASKSSGSAQQNLNKGLVEGHQTLIPSKEIVTAYEAIVGSLLDGWIENEKQAQTLATLRDTLLPRLISGQLRLPEAQTTAIEEAVA